MRKIYTIGRVKTWLTLCLMISMETFAQSYPSGPMRIVVPFPPGGGTDMLARLLSRKLNENWGQSVITDNRPGANGTIGAAFVAKAIPDGHTLLLVPSGFTVNPSIYPKLPFNSERDLAPVTQLASGPLLVMVHPSLPAKSIQELIALAKARPGTINYASSGNGSPPHLATELFKYMAGVNLIHIPYKGGGPAMVDLLAGQVSIYFNAILQALPYVKAGRLRSLAVTSGKRFPSVPEIPTIAESGVPGYDMTNWYGLLVTGGTPKAGYVFSVLTAQLAAAPGGARSYLSGTHMTLGYALSACPSQYDGTGRNAFLVSNSGTIYQQDNGAQANTATGYGASTTATPPWIVSQ